ncbi:response regulator transcription factor [Paenibacillus sacheonensis]|uniref:Response regulator n=1 Tax=Paenibacillus sacheonensis TaxID=742054 RepID=A0A7X5C3P5_9BACL|nr:response regulator [Paenibacillus sacheonensis]MBM7568852.1 two-component system response regulator YesN [Paenibacillus sacheonensis]NBC72555.1 response regulator [Paenibacillus sacheonensis]
MNILIVDDEPRHVRGMVHMLRTMRPDARVTTAKDGETALASVRAELPDVVLSDIQMPNMDGLTFLKRLEEEELRTKVVMVSAYNLFEYAQTAVRHGAYDYLLKPVDTGKVDALLERLEQQLAAELQEREASAEMLQRLQLASPAYRSRLLHQWLAGELPAEERAGLYDWELLREVDVLIVTEINRQPQRPTEMISKPRNSGDSDKEADSQSMPLQALTEELSRLASAFGQACVFPLQTEPNQAMRLVTALKLAKPLRQEELRGALLAITDAWRQHGIIRHGIGSMPTSGEEGMGSGEYADIPSLYRQARTALGFAFHDEWQGVVFGEALIPQSASAAFSLDGEELFEALQEPTPAAAEALCRRAFRELAAQGHAEPKLMKDHAALMLMKIKSRTRDIVDPQVGNVLTGAAASDIAACPSSSALMELLLECLNAVQRSLAERKQGRGEFVVDTCLSWIQANYQADITLEMAAVQFHFNASYFSTLIKSRTGRSFSEHVTEARMRRAKELLAAGRLKIYEIADQCGYRDTKYFTRMFKRQVGLSPEAYKHTARPNAGNEEAP